MKRAQRVTASKQKTLMYALCAVAFSEKHLLGQSDQWNVPEIKITLYTKYASARLNNQSVKFSGPKPKVGIPMNYATQELTASLQELTSKSERQPRQIEQIVPASIAAKDFSFSKEVESFLEKSRDYSVRTRDVHVGMY